MTGDGTPLALDPCPPGTFDEWLSRRPVTYHGTPAQTAEERAAHARKAGRAPHRVWCGFETMDRARVREIARAAALARWTGETDDTPDRP